MRIAFPVFILVLFIAQIVSAATPTTIPSGLVNSDTYAIIVLDLKRVTAKDLRAALHAIQPADDGTLNDLFAPAGRLEQTLREAGVEAVGSMEMNGGPGKVTTMGLIRPRDGDDGEQVVQWLRGSLTDKRLQAALVATRVGGWRVVRFSSAELPALDERRQKIFLEAAATLNDDPLVMVVSPTYGIRKLALDESLKEYPGYRMFMSLLRMRWATLSARFGDDPRIELAFEMPDEDAANRARDRLVETRDSDLNELRRDTTMPEARKAEWARGLEVIQPRLEGTRLRLTLNKQMIGAVFPLVAPPILIHEGQAALAAHIAATQPIAAKGQ